eukprot:gnl/Hemi2/1186_TR423_c0_g1_i1.p1 gnl/Hemi2/1186_TR423_c0_g1~~gnl/Hemi2/1186_TR423_c0_g1_i1.p1  ORF type:complete len:209 (+),score=44.18 gnl/Hemi2/1186_TR423_c0_g1_i1:34-627(+)
MPLSSVSTLIVVSAAVALLLLAYIMNCRRIKELSERVAQAEARVLTCPDAYEVSSLSEKKVQSSQREVQHRLTLVEQMQWQHHQHIDSIAEYLRLSAGDTLGQDEEGMVPGTEDELFVVEGEEGELKDASHNQESSSEAVPSMKEQVLLLLNHSRPQQQQQKKARIVELPPEQSKEETASTVEAPASSSSQGLTILE